MSAVFGEPATLIQESGPEVELRVFGDEHYARYETPSGYSAVYDRARGLYCYARLVEGALTSTGVPVAQPPPDGLVPHLEETPAVRLAKAAARRR